jgi:starch synthase
MKRIALVRGHHLSKEETVSYEPLKNEFDFVCVSSDAPWYDHSEILFPVIQTRSVERWFTLPNRRFFRNLTGTMDKALGTGQWMPGLAGALRGFDLVYTSDYSHLFTYQVARLRRRMRFKLVVMQYENIPFARENRPWMRFMKRLIQAEADMFFAMSERAKEALLIEGVSPNRIAVIGNSVDTQMFRPNQVGREAWRRRFGIKPEEILILFIGRLHETKGVFELIHAAWRLMQDPAIDRSSIRFLLIGKGRAERSLRARISKLGIEDRVGVVTGVPHNEVHLAHAMADIFTLPSIPVDYWQEQFGIVLIESMASGKPIVTTISGSIPEVVGDAAVLVQPADHLALYHAFKDLVLSKEKCRSLGNRARARAEELFSLDVVSERLRRAIRSTLNVTQ